MATVGSIKEAQGECALCHVSAPSPKTAEVWGYEFIIAWVTSKKDSNVRELRAGFVCPICQNERTNEWNGGVDPHELFKIKGCEHYNTRLKHLLPSPTQSADRVSETT